MCSHPWAKHLTVTTLWSSSFSRPTRELYLIIVLVLRIGTILKLHFNVFPTGALRHDCASACLCYYSKGSGEPHVNSSLSSESLFPLLTRGSPFHDGNIHFVRRSSPLQSAYGRSRSYYSTRWLRLYCCALAASYES